MYILLEDGTYELCGPRIQKNPEKLDSHILLKHGSVTYENVPVDFEGQKEWLSDKDIEGLVFHRENGDMVKAAWRSRWKPMLSWLQKRQAMIYRSLKLNSFLIYGDETYFKHIRLLPHFLIFQNK